MKGSNVYENKEKISEKSYYKLGSLLKKFEHSFQKMQNSTFFHNENHNSQFMDSMNNISMVKNINLNNEIPSKNIIQKKACPNINSENISTLCNLISKQTKQIKKSIIN